MKHPISKQPVTDGQIRGSNRETSLIENEEVFYTDNELDRCTVIPKEAFILFENNYYTPLTNSISNEKRNLFN